MAMGIPMHRKMTALDRFLKRAGADLFIVLGRRGLPRDRAARKHDAGIIRASGLCQTQQRILAGAAGADDENELAGSDRVSAAGGEGQSFGHATRSPSRQTLRTTGMSRATCTRIRSARLPVAISPRSESQTASAGALVTVRTADARSIAGTCCGSCSAAINRLDGM